MLLLLAKMQLLLAAASGLSAAATAEPLALTVAVDPRNISDRVSEHMYGSGIETYENQMYGGLWSNMILSLIHI